MNLASTLRDTDQSFLFLGFDLSDWHFRVLLHILSNNAYAELRVVRLRARIGTGRLGHAGLLPNEHKIHFFSG